MTGQVGHRRPGVAIRQIRVDQRAALVEPWWHVLVADSEIERHVPAHPPRIGEVVRLADRAELGRRERHCRFGAAHVAEQEVGKRGAAWSRHARRGSRGPSVEHERTARELVADLVVVIEPDAGAGFDRVRAADPGHVVGELEHLVPVGVGTLRAVPEPAEPGDADGRNPPRLWRARRHTRNVELGDHIAFEGQLASVGVVERVEPEAELVEHRRRQRVGVADHELVNRVEQLRAVQLQRRGHFIVMAPAVAAHPVQRRALDEVHALGVLLPVDHAIDPRDVVVRRARRVRLRIELEQLLRDLMDPIRRNAVARETAGTSGSSRRQCRSPDRGAAWRAPRNRLTAWPAWAP